MFLQRPICNSQTFCKVQHPEIDFGEMSWHADPHRSNNEHHDLDPDRMKNELSFSGNLSWDTDSSLSNLGSANGSSFQRVGQLLLLRCFFGFPKFLAKNLYFGQTQKKLGRKGANVDIIKTNEVRTQT